MVKIVILTQYFPPEIGAAQVRLESFAQALLRQGHEVVVVAGMPNYPTGRIFAEYRKKVFVKERYKGLKVYRSWLLSAKEIGIARLLSYISYAVSSLRFAFQTARNADYIFVETPPPVLGLSAFLVSRIRGVPFILNIADLWPEWPVRAGMLKNKAMILFIDILVNFLYKRAAYITVVTKNMKGELVNKRKISPEKILWLPNGVDMNIFKPVKPSTKEKKVFLYAGNHGIYNWPVVIVQAAAILKNREDIHFLLVGDGSQKDEVIRYARDESLTNVSFLDPVPLEEVPKFFAAAYASLVTYKKGFPSRPAKLFPALASAMPVVYSGEGEGAALVRERRCGIVVDPEEPLALADAICLLADDEMLAIELGENGLKLARSEYSWDSIVENWVKELAHKN